MVFMNHSEGETLDCFLEKEDWKSWNRSCMEWYGFIVWTTPDAFLFHLMIVFNTDAAAPGGQAYFFKWDEDRRALLFTEDKAIRRPAQEGDRLMVFAANERNEEVSPEIKFARKLPKELVEAFLDERFQSEIFDNLSDPYKRLLVLRWLEVEGLPIYRRLKGPSESEARLYRAVLPRKIDLSEV
jgi:hypothetical protein